MFTIQAIDALVSHDNQLRDTSPEPVIVFNTFHVASWGAVIREFRAAGYISAQLYRGIAGSGTVVIQAVWESVAHYRAVFENPAFRARLSTYPASTVALPYLYRKVAVPGVCVA